MNGFVESADDSIFDTVEDNPGHNSSILEDSFSSIIAAASSTPVKQSAAVQGRHAGHSDPPQKVQEERFPCPQCGNTYANERTLAVHVKMNTLKGAASGVPTAEVLTADANGFLEECIKEISEEDESDPCSSLKIYCSGLLENLHKNNASLLAILVERFSDIISQNALLPSALRPTLYCKFNEPVNCDEFVDSCVDLNIYPGNRATVSAFFGIMSLKLFDKLLVFVLRNMRMAEGSISDTVSNYISQRSMDNVNSAVFQSVVYYISGFIIHSSILKGEKSSKSGTWSQFVHILKSKFVAIPGSECSDRVRLFTEKVDRGGLKHCSPQAFDPFFFFFFSTLFIFTFP